MSRSAAPVARPVLILGLALLLALMAVEAPPASAIAGGGGDGPSGASGEPSDLAGRTMPYVDVCDDADGSPLDLRGAAIEPQSDGLAFTVYTCQEWSDDVLDGRSFRWEVRADGAVVGRVVITRSDGALMWTATRLSDGAETTGPAERVSFLGEQRAVRAGIVLADLGAPSSFEFTLALEDDGAGVLDRIPDTGEPALSYPDRCPDRVAQAVVTTESGRYANALTAARGAGLRVTGELPSIDAFTVEGPAAAALPALERLPGVATVARPAPVQRLAVAPDDPRYPEQWALPQVQAPRAWEIRTGSGLRVAVVDDGVDTERIEIAGRVAAGHDTRFDRPLPEGTSSDRGGHGTAVASVLAAQGDNGVDIAGVDWSATIVPYRMFDAAGCGDDTHLAAAIVHAADAGIPVANLSVGTPDDTAVLREAVRYAHQQGTVLVAAVGNVRQTGNAPLYPANYPEAIGVGATLRGGEIASYSNTGSQVHVVAPGGRGSGQVTEDLLVLGERHRVEAVGGTSFSVPIVAGGVALYRAVDPRGNPQTVADALASSATDRGTAGYDQTYGHGLVDLYRLLLQAGVNRACPPGAVPPAGFADVAPGTVHTPAIDCVAWWGVARGVTATQYQPARWVNRAQMATFVARTIEATGTPLPVTADHFPDDNGNPHEANINKLAEAGVVQGRDGRYWPNDAVTRDQMAAFLVRATEHVMDEALSDGSSPFTDIAGNTHRAAIDKAYEAGLTRGRTATTYDPRAAVRRDQMASFLRNVLGGFAREGRASPPG